MVANPIISVSEDSDTFVTLKKSLGYIVSFRPRLNYIVTCKNNNKDYK